jgi:predicted transposase YbfD/YdcC
MISLDGKTRGHAVDQATATAAIQMVRAWARANRVVLGQRKVDEQSNAMTAIPTLLHRLDGKGAVVTIEAMGCPQDIATTMTEPGAESVVALKDHHPTRAEEVALWLNQARDTTWAGIAHASHETVDGDQGRSAIRRYWITAEIDWRDAQGSWANLHRVGMVESRRARGDKVQIETRYLLTSLPAEAVRVAEAVRQPWGVEHAWHGVLEVSLQEDACRIRKDKGAQTFAVLRPRAVNLLRREPRHTRGIKARRKRAGWDRDYRVQVLTGGT